MPHKSPTTEGLFILRPSVFGSIIILSLFIVLVFIMLPQIVFRQIRGWPILYFILLALSILSEITAYNGYLLYSLHAVSEGPVIFFSGTTLGLYFITATLPLALPFKSNEEYSKLLRRHFVPFAITLGMSLVLQIIGLTGSTGPAGSAQFYC